VQKCWAWVCVCVCVGEEMGMSDMGVQLEQEGDGPDSGP